MARGGQHRRFSGLGGIWWAWVTWWHSHIADTLDQAKVIADRRDESRLGRRHLLLLATSAAIAVLGLLQSSPAVVIGAMLLSPLMGPIIGIGFALATGDYRWMRSAGIAIAAGTALAIVISAIIVALSPLQTVTPEIAARTRPNLFDLFVALFSAIAGAYALVRGREGTVVGVAIATALMPPLAVVGFGLATRNWTVFSGAFLLFSTNLMTIALTAAVVARFYGFSRVLSDKQTWWQTVGIAAAFVALAVPLGLSLRKIAWEANASRQINTALTTVFPDRVRVSQIDIGYDARPIHIAATVLTPHIQDQAELKARLAISQAIGRPVEISLLQYQVGTSATAAEAAELATARAKEDTDSRVARALTDRLTLASGVPQEDILVDRERHRAVVDARPLPGATLETYYALEQRISAAEPEWQVSLRPPLLALPQVAFTNGEPSDEGRRNLTIAIWAARRLQLPIVAEGPTALQELMTQAGVTARVVKPARNPARLRWDENAPPKPPA